MKVEETLNLLTANPAHRKLSTHVLLLLFWHQFEKNNLALDQMGVFDEGFFEHVARRVQESLPELGHAFRKKLEIFRLESGSLATHQDYFKAIAGSQADEYSLQAAVLEAYLRNLENDGLSTKSRSCPIGLVQLLATLAQKNGGRSVYDPRCSTGRLLAGVVRNLPSGATGLGQALKESDAFHGLLRASSQDGELGIEKADALKLPPLESEYLRKFDLVVSDLSAGEDAWDQATCEADPFSRFRFGLPSPARGEFALIQHMIATMSSPDGVTMVIVDQSVLTRSGRDTDIRKSIIESNLLDTVIFLPPKLFRSDARSLAIVVFKASRRDTKILAINGTTGFVSGKSLNHITADSIQKISEHFMSRVATDNEAVLVSPEDILINDSAISLNRCFPSQSKTTALDLNSLTMSRKAIEGELIETSRTIDVLIESFAERS
jgi:type I restriction-modification system DNA methylase subunit